MKICSYCGQYIDDDAIFCPNCGARTNGDDTHRAYNNPYNPYNPGHAVNYDMSESKLVSVLCFIFWQIGIIYWLFSRRTRPGKASSAAKGVLASISLQMPIVGLIFWIVFKDAGKNGLAKICGISAIVGCALNVAAFLFFGVMKSLGFTWVVDLMPEMFGAGTV